MMFTSVIMSINTLEKLQKFYNFVTKTTLFENTLVEHLKLAHA